MSRGRRTLALWVLLWLAAAVVLACESLDAWRRAAPALVWAFKVRPLLVLLPLLYADRLRAVVWVAFVSLLYFLIAVQRVFAEPGSARAIIELGAVVLLFVSATFYVRYRARELRAATLEESS